MIRSCVEAKASGGLPGPLQFGYLDTDHFDADDLKRIARLARELRDEVRNLKRTNLVFELQIGGRIPPGDLLSAPLADEEVAALKTLMDLPAIARSHKKTHLPGMDYSLWRVCRFVGETTGHPNDRLLVDIVGPLRIPHTQSPDALKVWRNHLQS
jgi:methionine synthase II (cobalamin-independent)